MNQNFCKEVIIPEQKYMKGRTFIFKYYNPNNGFKQDDQLSYTDCLKYK